MIVLMQNRKDIFHVHEIRHSKSDYINNFQQRILNGLLWEPDHYIDYEGIQEWDISVYGEQLAREKAMVFLKTNNYFKGEDVYILSSKEARALSTAMIYAEVFSKEWVVLWTMNIKTTKTLLKKDGNTIELPSYILPCEELSLTHIRSEYDNDLLDAGEVYTDTHPWWLTQEMLHNYQLSRKIIECFPSHWERWVNFAQFQRLTENDIDEVIKKMDEKYNIQCEKKDFSKLFSGVISYATIIEKRLHAMEKLRKTIALFGKKEKPLHIVCITHEEKILPALIFDTQPCPPFARKIKNCEAISYRVPLDRDDFEKTIIKPLQDTLSSDNPFYYKKAI